MRKPAPYPNTQTPVITPKQRCAVYTRKSTDEGLDMEYNSLEAQRDAGLAYIASQRGCLSRESSGTCRAVVGS